jgi:TatD DNase family protein
MDTFLVDTHTHLYLSEFDVDRDLAVSRALQQNVRIMMLPNIDVTSIGAMNDLAERFPLNCFPMMGLHPVSVRENFREELKIIEDEIKKGRYFGIGETGIDLYWETKFLSLQQDAFEKQVRLALEYSLPLVIHARNSFNEILEIVEIYKGKGLKGIFHAFSGDISAARRVIDMGFMLGIGGVLTFKNSKLADVVREIPIEHIVLETDSPYLAPVPYRGKRNESSYITLVAEALAAAKGIDYEEAAFLTSGNAMHVFNKLGNDS